MKKQKFILTTLLALLLCTAGLFAQMAEMGTTTFGIRAGINFQNINGEDAAGNDLENDLVPRWHAGVNVEIPIAPDFYVQPGIMFTTKGAKDNVDILGQTTETTLNLGYIEVPIHLIYKPLLGTGHIIVGLGPYFGYGLTGKMKFESNGNETEIDVEYENEVDEGDLTGDAFFVSPLDIGANIMAGYEFSNLFSFQLNTQLGLVDMNPDIVGATETDAKSTHTGFGVSLGFRF